MTLTLTLLDALSHGPKPPNEDAHGAAPGAVWVIDGATGVGLGPDILPPSGAAWLAGTLSDALAEIFRTGPATGLDAAVARAEERVWRRYAEAMREEPVPDAPDMPTACLGLAVAEDGALALGVIGDISILHRGAGGRVTHLTDSASAIFSTLTLAMLAEVRAARPGEDPWPHVRGQIRENRRMANRPGGYNVVHPVLPWRDRVEVTRVPAAAGDVLLLASDGFFRLVDHFGLHTEADLVQAALDEGLDAMLERLRAEERADAGGDRAPRVKMHDDATAVLVRVED